MAFITAMDPVVVVVGGAGSGKTTTAAAAAARRLTDLDEHRAALRRGTPFGTVPTLPPTKRVLFISFSRTAVSQIIDRAASVPGAASTLLPSTASLGASSTISAVTTASPTLLGCGQPPRPSSA